MILFNCRSDIRIFVVFRLLFIYSYIWVFLIRVFTAAWRIILFSNPNLWKVYIFMLINQRAILAGMLFFSLALYVCYCDIIGSLFLVMTNCACSNILRIASILNFNSVLGNDAHWIHHYRLLVSCLRSTLKSLGWLVHGSSVTFFHSISKGNWW